MQEAIREARIGQREGGIPIGAVLVRKGKILGRGRNQWVQKNSTILHAEIDCLQNAGKIINYKGAVLYTTLAPCYMCSGAVVFFKIKEVVIGYDLNDDETERFLKSHGVKVVNLRSKECAEMMDKFIEENPKLWKEEISE